MSYYTTTIEPAYVVLIAFIRSRVVHGRLSCRLSLQGGIAKDRRHCLWTKAVHSLPE
jgi:hypothetical protein